MTSSPHPLKAPQSSSEDVILAFIADPQRVAAGRRYATSQKTAAEFVDVATRLGEPRREQRST